MNKFGIKVYADRVYYINDIHWKVNSIKHHCSSPISTSKFRLINGDTFGIKFIYYKKIG